MNAYRLLADLIVVVHAAWVAVVVFGLAAILLGAGDALALGAELLLPRDPFRDDYRVVFETLFGISCPLTVWEGDLREMAGETAEEGTSSAASAHQ